MHLSNAFINEMFNIKSWDTLGCFFHEQTDTLHLTLKHDSKFYFISVLCIL